MDIDDNCKSSLRATTYVRGTSTHGDPYDEIKTDDKNTLTEHHVAAAWVHAWIRPRIATTSETYQSVVVLVVISGSTCLFCALFITLVSSCSAPHGV